ncbi:hypothetical protein GCM10022381_38710 [Leifsonia kafniensis]|uniref:Uncharacterized protein n=1 Tax=Leifsonia kafniensis TaxID=475957 RepID=A0ABP7L1L2_9MICO
MSRPKRLISNIPFVTATLTLGSVSFAIFFVVVLSTVSLVFLTDDFKGIWFHTGLLGNEILDGATWLLPSFIGALFVVAVIPHDETESNLGDYVSVKEGLTRLIPFVVGVLTFVSFIFCVIGAAAYPGKVYELYAVSALSFVIFGTSLVLVTGTFSLPSMRLREAVGAHSQIQSALRKVRPLVEGVPSSPFTKALRAILATAVIAAFPGLALLAIQMGIGMTPDWKAIGFLLGLSGFFAIVSFVSLFLWLVSSRGISDRLLAVCVPCVIIGAGAVIVFLGAISSGVEAVAVSLIPLVLVPFIVTWVPAAVPAPARRHSLRNASAIAAYRYLTSRLEAAESDLLTSGVSKPDEEDRSILRYLGVSGR